MSDCDAKLYIAADDPFCAAEIGCDLPEGHEGEHEYALVGKGSCGDGNYVIKWEKITVVEWGEWD